ncbi:MAG: hypothetical protein ABIP94_18560 [Planctomycetota bacterium]
MPTALSLRDRILPAAAAGALALAVGTAAYLLSCWLVPPGTTTSGFGEQWQYMSADPLGLLGQLPHRILGPLLAYVFGMGGGLRYVYFVRGLAVLMLAVVFLYCRQQKSRAIDAALVTCAVAVTAPVQMYKLHWVGYTDPLCYALFFVMAMAARHTVVFWSLFFLNLLNHELALFFLPWLWFLRREAGGSWRADALGAGAALVLYAAFYYYVKAHAAQQLFSADYFLSHPLFPGGTFAVWALALVQWTVAYGPLLAVLAWHQHRSTIRRDRWHFWLVFGGILAVFCIAFDWQRHTNLIVLPFALASVRFLAAGHRLAYAGLGLVSVLLFLRWPAWGGSDWPTNQLWPPLFESRLVFAKGLDYDFGGVREFALGWVPLVWPILLSVYAILAGIWLVGFWFARRERARANQGPAII